MSDAKTQEAQSGPPTPVGHALRLVGSILILVAVFFIVPRMMPSELESPPYNVETFNTEQREAYEQVMAGAIGRAKALEISTVDGAIMYTRSGRKPTPERPEWLDENNQPTVPDDLKERIASRATLPAPSWMRLGSIDITYAEHNAIAIIGPQFFGFFGLLSSISLYLVFFWVFPGRRKRESRPVAAIWLALMVVLFGYAVPVYTNFVHSLWPLVLFSAPMLAMFLLWALTRSDEEEEVVEEATESVSG